MNPKQEVVKIRLEEPVAKKAGQLAQPAKIAIRIKAEKQDVFIYNGANQYLVQTVLKELSAYVS